MNFTGTISISSGHVLSAFFSADTVKASSPSMTYISKKDIPIFLKELEIIMDDPDILDDAFRGEQQS